VFPISPPVSQLKAVITASTVKALFIFISFSLFGKRFMHKASLRGIPVINNITLVNRDTQSDFKSYIELQNLIGGE
jgi:hypothetical protein